MIGLLSGIVQLVPHQPEWATLFETEKQRLQTAIGSYILDIQHVGSTAIPHIPAKPIIDIAIAVKSFDEATVCIAPLEAIGYIYRGENGIPRRHYFRRGNPRTHHLHMLEIDSDDWQKHLLFRDYLIKHPAVAQQYATLKTELAHQYSDDRPHYTTAKMPFIQEVLLLARQANEVKPS